MKSLFHYYLVTMATVTVMVLVLVWSMVARIHPPTIVFALGITIAVVIFAIGVVQYMRGKIGVWD